jgi:hypothetical protein
MFISKKFTDKTYGTIRPVNALRRPKRHYAAKHL